MAKLPEIHREAGEYLKKLLQEELIDQGHVLSGSLVSTMEIRWDRQGMVIRARYYAIYQDQPMESGKASFRMWPKLTNYFIRQGYPRKSAQQFARFTILSWMKHGRPSPGSYTFSRNGHRTNFIQRAVDKSDLDALYSIRLREWFFDEVDGKIKSERI